MSFADDFDQNEKEHGLGRGSWFKFQEGDNKMRVLEKPVMMREKFKVGVVYPGCEYENDDKLTTKYLTRIINRATGQIELVKLPYKIAGALAQMSREDGGFEFPMPFDINIYAKGAGKTTVQYTLTASRKDTPLTKNEQDELETQTPVEQVLEKMQDKQREKMDHNGQVERGEIPTDDVEINPDDIPFDDNE